MKRRDFLKLCLASGLGRSLPFVGPLFVNRSYQAPKLSQELCLIHLDGGNDAYNTVVPYTLDSYYKSRPTLSLKPDSLLYLNKKFGLHPALKNLHGLFQKGQVAIYPGIGYPGVSFSHVRASQIWHTGELETLSSSFWARERLNSKLRPVSISICDFDTHFDQRPKHEKALLELDQKIAQLSKGAYCLVFSEMGRSLKENEDRGTDHGHANLAFLIGENISGGIYGDYTENEEQYSTDFRALYRQIDTLGIGRAV